MGNFVCLALILLLTSCALTSRTAYITCRNRVDLELCVEKQLGHRVRIVGAEKIESGLYLVKYYE